jgi:hypothetical protein
MPIAFIPKEGKEEKEKKKTYTSLPEPQSNST